MYHSDRHHDIRNSDIKNYITTLKCLTREALITFVNVNACTS